MSGVGFSEFLILCLIGLIVLGPRRLPQVASQIGSWVGQARRMTRVMKRQLEEELNFDEDLNIRPKTKAPAYEPPRDDDDYSPLHKQPGESDGEVADVDVDDDFDKDVDEDAVDDGSKLQETAASDDDEHDAKT
jgi:Tat protein translocase TatB subunit